MSRASQLLCAGVLSAGMGMAAAMPSDQLDSIFQGPRADTQWSCAVADAETGAVLYRRNGDKALAPASNQKILVAAIALKRLGPDYAPATLVCADGPIKDGVLLGNLVFRGRGAIHFSGRHRGLAPKGMADLLETQIAAVAAALKSLGVEAVQGRFIADNTDWGGTAYPAYPAAAPLMFHENTVDVTVTDGDLRHCPRHAYDFSLKSGSTKSGQRRPRFGLNGTDVIEFNPRIDSVDYWRLERGDPDKRYLTQVQAGLMRNGLRVSGLHVKSGEVRTLVTLPGLNVSNLMYPILSWSDNLRAEVLFRSIGYVHQGRSDADDAAQAVEALAAPLGLDPDKVVIRDGSGLDAKNRLSAEDLTKLLAAAYNSEHWPLWKQSLALAGERGTLKAHLRSPQLLGRVFGKTGTIRGAKCLSGVFLPKNGAPLVFSFLCKNPSDSASSWKIFERALNVLAATNWSDDGSR